MTNQELAMKFLASLSEEDKNRLLSEFKANDYHELTLFLMQERLENLEEKVFAKDLPNYNETGQEVHVELKCNDENRGA